MSPFFINIYFTLSYTLPLLSMIYFDLYYKLLRDSLGCEVMTLYVHTFIYKFIHCMLVQP